MITEKLNNRNMIKEKTEKKKVKQKNNHRKNAAIIFM